MAAAGTPYSPRVAELTALSKAVSRALRHEPWAYGLDLDAEGWTPLAAVRDGLRAASPRWRALEVADLEEMVHRSTTQRYEIVGPDIRAFYGHSVPDRIARTRAAPPRVLRHGTTARAAEVILTEGLRPMRRQYVHLSVDVETARRVGGRTGADTVVLEIAAAAADAAGVAFYPGNQAVWLADAVPAQFISRTGNP